MKKAFVIKLLHYEYWPMWTFYLPLFPYFLFQGILKGNLFYFTNANPGMDEFGGLFSDSKFTTDELLPAKCRPLSFFIDAIRDKNEIETKVKQLNLNYPLIMKPNSGERGEGVVKLKDEQTLCMALHIIGKPILIQEYIAYPCEYGVFIAYIPEKDIYKVVSITEKKYFNVQGDGINNIRSLILQQERGIVFFENIRARSEYEMDYIPKDGENCILHTLGNHCNGTEFINRNNLKSNGLDKRVNDFMRDVKGINYGRFDIKVQHTDDLISFRNFKIIEFNGVASEPIHIYDSTTGYFNALRTFIYHWKLLNDIAIFNKKHGGKPAAVKSVINKILSRSFYL